MTSIIFLFKLVHLNDLLFNEKVNDVDQLEETNNGSLSWALPHSGLKLNEMKLNKSILD